MCPSKRGVDCNLCHREQDDDLISTECANSRAASVLLTPLQKPAPMAVRGVQDIPVRAAPHKIATALEKRKKNNVSPRQHATFPAGPLMNGKGGENLPPEAPAPSPSPTVRKGKRKHCACSLIYFSTSYTQSVVAE